MQHEGSSFLNFLLLLYKNPPTRDDSFSGRGAGFGLLLHSPSNLFIFSSNRLESQSSPLPLSYLDPLYPLKFIDHRLRSNLHQNEHLRSSLEIPLVPNSLWLQKKWKKKPEKEGGELGKLSEFWRRKKKEDARIEKWGNWTLRKPSTRVREFFLKLEDTTRLPSPLEIAFFLFSISEPRYSTLSLLICFFF